MSADRWTHHDAGVREIIARETAALTAENEDGDDWTSPEGYDDSPDMGVHRFDGGGGFPFGGL